jgi:pimeloyl-ACP methyl ester carboxylesterase
VATRIDVDGHPTWIEERGDASSTVLLLHSGLSDSDTMLATLGPSLEQSHRIVAFDRRGHGYTADIDAPFHYEDMAIETIAVLEQVVGGSAHLVGWSDGGIVALLVALRRPDLVDRVVVIGTNFHHDGLLPLEFDEESSAALLEGYSARSPDGADHFPRVLEKFVTMLSTEPTLTTEDLARVAAPTLVLVGDDDLVKLDHTCALYEALPAGQLSVVPAASHLLPIEKPEETNRIILGFLAADAPPETFMPLRRRRASEGPAPTAAG